MDRRSNDKVEPIPALAALVIRYVKTCPGSLGMNELTTTEGRTVNNARAFMNREATYSEYVRFLNSETLIIGIRSGLGGSLLAMVLRLR